MAPLFVPTQHVDHLLQKDTTEFDDWPVDLVPKVEGHVHLFTRIGIALLLKFKILMDLKVSLSR